MKPIALILISAAALLVACTGDKPLSQYEATNEEAIFNVVMIDNGRLSELVILPVSMPDTLAFIADPDPAQPLYWHVVDSTTDDFRVIFSDQPVQSPIGLVNQANATITRTWQGVLNILRYNDNADSLERYSKEFELTATRSAICQQWGQTSQRRGWLLTAIGHARFVTPGHDLAFLNNLTYDSDSNDDTIFHTGTTDLDDIPRFDAGEEVTLRFRVNDETNLVYVYTPIDNFGYELASPVPDGAGGYQVSFVIPSISRIYGQFRFLVINAGHVSIDYAASGYSFNYRVR
jgi:hypothetical protein